LTGPFTKGSVL